MSTTIKCSLTSIQKSKSFAKTLTFNAGTSELIAKKKHLNFLTLHSPFCLLLIKILELNCHPEYF